MARILKSPAQYVQGEGILNEFDKYLKGMGQKLLIIISQSGIKRIRPTLDKCFEGKDYELIFEVFSGESTKDEVNRLLARAKEEESTVIVGIGGGKIVDTAKGVSHFSELPMIIVPTVASTDSACSSLSILYKENGVYDSYLFLNACPNLVLVDTGVIAKAPVKLLVAGMGDAMATYFEARACKNSGSNNQVAGKPTQTATELATLCWKYLKADGLKAKMAAEAGVCTTALENIVEVNTYLSSVGFESGGLGAAHAITKGLTHIPELHEAYHGETVAFCTITQLILENATKEEINEVVSFCDEIGLPITFADMGYEEIDLQKVMKASEVACAVNTTIHNMPFEVTPSMVYAALLTTDVLGKAYRERGSQSV